jgi:hypothetical protein
VSAIVIARPYFHLTLAHPEWQLAAPGDGVDVKCVSLDGRHELYVAILIAANDPSRSFARLDGVHRESLASALQYAPGRVVEAVAARDVAGPANACGFTIDYGASVLRRRILSMLGAHGAFGEPGRWQVIANVSLYSHGAAPAEAEQRLAAVLAGLHVAPSSHVAVVDRSSVGSLPLADDDDDIDDDDIDDDGVDDDIEMPSPATALPWPVSRAQLAPYAGLLQVWGVADPIDGLPPIGHDVFVTTTLPRSRDHWLSSMRLLPNPDLDTAFANIARHAQEVCLQRITSPSGQAVVLLHGHPGCVSLALLGVMQPEFSELLGSSRVLACFPRPHLAALFADAPPPAREELRGFVLAGAGEVCLSDRLFELTGVGGARPLAG